MSKIEKIKAEIERRIEKCDIFYTTALNTKGEKAMSIIGLQKENYKSLLSYINSLEEEPVSENLEEAAWKYYDKNKPLVPHELDLHKDMIKFFIAGTQWQKANLWKDAQGDDLPKIDREVIVLVKSLPEREDSLLKVCFAHRPQEYWDGKNIATGEITRYYPKKYGKGGWSSPDVKWWLDLDLPKMEE